MFEVIVKIKSTNEVLTKMNPTEFMETIIKYFGLSKNTSLHDAIKKYNENYEEYEANFTLNNK